jgi:small-conductance mechanosensitive channel
MASSFVLYAVFRGSKLFRTFLRSRVFPRTGWDLGVQYSISTILQYAIIIGGVLLAMNILGFPLASLTLLAGALGIGAGLGLQGVISNFVSGLVLLFERPIKVGDMLVIDGQWGEVKSINMRSTVFQNVDRSVLIIPNSDLLSAKIINWNHYGAGPNRLTLSVGVSYSSDVRLVTRLLQQICQANPRVLKDPAPQIFFEAYGDSSLNFSVRVFVHTAKDRVPTTHEINTAIFETFQEKGIEMPFPQRDLHIIDERKCTPREGEELGAPLAG